MCHFEEEESATVKADVIEQDVIGETPTEVSVPKNQPKPFPIFMIGVSLIQIVFYYFGYHFLLHLCYDPHRRHEIWRFLTVMLIHNSAKHLWTNLTFQLMLGGLLEVVHHWKRVGIIYMCGVVGGSLCVSVIEPDKYGLGASAGVYALLLAHVAAIFLNCKWNEVDYKCYPVVFLIAYIAFMVVLPLFYQLVGTKESNVSHAGHFGGAVTGFLISILVMRKFEKRPRDKRLQIICAGILVSLAFPIIIVNIVHPIQADTSNLNSTRDMRKLLSNEYSKRTKEIPHRQIFPC